MTNRNDETPRRSYALKAGEENRRYAQDLLAENERLRFLAATLEHERTGLLEKVRMVDHLLAENDAMRRVVADLEKDRGRLQEQLLRATDERARHERDQDDLRRRLAGIEAESRRFSEEYVEVERRNNDLMNLYVASYRLHGTVDRQEVLGTIQEIVANLVGCEGQAIFEVGPGETEMRLVASTGIDQVALATVQLGEGPIGKAALAGEIHVAGGASPIEDPAQANLTACIPLTLNGRVTGAIALFRLLPEKPALEDVDHELFELLATHAATALYCSGLHASLGLE